MRARIRPLPPGLKKERQSCHLGTCQSAPSRRLQVPLTTRLGHWRQVVRVSAIRRKPHNSLPPWAHVYCSSGSPPFAFSSIHACSGWQPVAARQGHEGLYLCEAHHAKNVCGGAQSEQNMSGFVGVIVDVCCSAYAPTSTTY